MVSGDDRDDRRRVIIYGGGDLHYGVATRFVALLTETVCIAAPTPVTYVTPTLQALTVFDQEKSTRKRIGKVSTLRLTVDDERKNRSRELLAVALATVAIVLAVLCCH